MNNFNGIYKTGIFYDFYKRDYVLTKTEKDYKKLLKNMDALIELVGGKDQQVKPYFDDDMLKEKNERFEKTDEIMYLSQSCQKIHEMFPGKPIYTTKRPAKDENGNILREKNGKVQYSYHFTVGGVRISNKNIKKLMEKHGLGEHNKPFDTNIYDPNRGLFSIYTYKKVDKKTNKIIEVPQFIPFDIYGMQDMSNINITDYWVSYIEEDYEDWDEWYDWEDWNWDSDEDFDYS